MPVTLNDAKQLSQDKLTDQVIDEFRQSPLLNALPFDNTVKPQGGRSLTYSYNRITTQPSAGSRALNSEYTPQETKTTKVNVDLKVFGGSYEVDRVIAQDETQVVNHVEFQSRQKAKATIAVFHDQFINGDSEGDDPNSFDGIDKAVTGTSTELIPSTPIDLSSAEAINQNYRKFLYWVRKMVGRMDGAATHFLMNNDLYTAFQAVADHVPNIRYDRDELGNEVIRYGNAVFVDMGDKPGTTSPVIPTAEDGTTTLYAIRVGEDGVHGVSPDGSKLVNVYLPDMGTSGAVKKGEVEMVAAVAVKSTKAVAALRNIKVVDTSESESEGE